MFALTAAAVRRIMVQRRQPAMEQESIFGAEAYQPLAARLRPATLE